MTFTSLKEIRFTFNAIAMFIFTKKIEPELYWPSSASYVWVHTLFWRVHVMQWLLNCAMVCWQVLVFLLCFSVCHMVMLVFFFCFNCVLLLSSLKNIPCIQIYLHYLKQDLSYGAVCIIVIEWIVALLVSTKITHNWYIFFLM